MDAAASGTQVKWRARRMMLQRTAKFVWSWRPKVGVKLAMMLRVTPATVTTKPGHREITYKP